MARLSGRLQQAATTGIALSLLLALAWLTGLDYALVRLRLGSPVGQALVDGVHLYAGVAAIPLILAKARLARTRSQPPAQAGSRWHRAMSMALLVLYAGVVLTGAALVLPGPLDHESVARAHLLVAVWAAVPTTWHAWYYARRLAPPPAPATGLLVVAVLLAPLAFVISRPAALSVHAHLGDGDSWQASGLAHTYLTQVATGAGGIRVAAGDGLYVIAPGERKWRQVGPPDLVLTLVLPDASHPAYLGTNRGLYVGFQVAGPFRRLPLPSSQVRGVLAPRAQPGVLLATSLDGVWRSDDAGVSWAPFSRGLASPATAWSVAEFEGRLYASDSDAVYRLEGERWQPDLELARVVSLDAGSDPKRLYASSIGGGIGILDGRSWRQARFALGGHGPPHVSSVTALGGGLVIAATSDGVGASTDAGATWQPLGRDLTGETSRVTAAGRELLAATSAGIYSYRRPELGAAPPAWWAVAISLALGAGTVGAALLSLSLARGGRLRRRALPGAGRRRWRPGPGGPS